jgi:hypothetical protein
MEILTAFVLRFDVPPQLIVASTISVLAYLALLGSLLTFRSIANGLHASAKRVRAYAWRPYPLWNDCTPWWRDD